MEIFQLGDRVAISSGDRTVDGEVTLASPCGRSLIVVYEAILDGHVGMMPVLYDDERGFVALLTGNAVTLQRRSP